MAAKIIAIALPLGASQSAYAQQKQQNILVIWGDDIGIDNINIGAYHRGLMGGRTPNIDRLAKEGLLLTDHYAHQSCTAGRASFIMGQNPPKLAQDYQPASRPVRAVCL